MIDMSLISPEIQSLESRYNLLNSLNLWLLIVAGIIALAIAVVAILSSRAGNQLKNVQAEEIRAKDEQHQKDIALLNAETEKAKEERAKTDLKIEEARADSSKANVQAQSAIAAAAEARAETANALKEQERIRRQNLELSLQVEKERVARLKIEEHVAPRRLRPDQKKKLKEILFSLPPEDIALMYYIGADDSAAYTTDFYETFTAGGWSSGTGGPTSDGGNLTGVCILVKDASQAPAKAHLLLKSLKAVGIEARLISAPDEGDNPFTLFIGRK